MDARPDVIVIGGGVIGLTTAVALLDAGIATQIVTAETYEHTTSIRSGAIWGPFLSELDDRVVRWSFETLDVFVELARDTDTDTGVALVDGMLAADADADAPEWLGLLDATPCAASDVPAPYARGWRYRVPIIDMPRYLRHLTHRVVERGGVIERQHVSALDDLARRAPHLVVCTGLGARELLHDDTLRAQKGQLVVVENPGVSTFFAANPDDQPLLTYVLPHRDRVVLGGTAEWDDESTDVDPETARAIVARCSAIAPALAGARVVEQRAGVRPYRPTVRLEQAVHDGQHVVYNYGHGGSGVSLSWGCANAVVSEVTACTG